MEKWKEIPGYEGIYEASNEGQIRSIEGKTTFTERHGKRVWKQRILKLKCCKDSKGRKDYRVELWKNGEHRTWLVARLIALAWCDGYEDGLTVNHIDGNPLNNKSDNLEWISLAHNIKLGFENGLYPTKECVLVDDNGNKKQFRSESQASRWLGRNEHYIACCKNRNSIITSSEGRHYKIIF